MNNTTTAEHICPRCHLIATASAEELCGACVVEVIAQQCACDLCRDRQDLTKPTAQPEEAN